MEPASTTKKRKLQETVPVADKRVRATDPEDDDSGAEDDREIDRLRKELAAANKTYAELTEKEADLMRQLETRTAESAAGQDNDEKEDEMLRVLNLTNEFGQKIMEISTAMVELTEEYKKDLESIKKE
ncbi:hypothetical protein SLS58_003444 [Diplodia intermedia]|uniref:Uncharacterized protein n=1 Tax=Diplodia intermedia TaxID=856260 RepID=A0ABR3TWD7_9PEZI